MTRRSIVISTTLLAVIATPQLSHAQVQAPLLEPGLRIAQAEPAPKPDEKKLDEKKKPEHPPGQRPPQGATPQQHPPATPPAHPGPAAATPPAAHPGPAAATPPAHPGPAAATPPVQPGPAAATPPAHPGPATATPQHPVAPPPATAQTPTTPPQRSAPGAPRTPAAATTAPVQAPAANAQPARPAVAAPAVAAAPVAGHLDQLRNERHETHEGNRTVIQEGDRTIVREGGHDIIRHNEAGRFALNARVNVEHRGSDTVTVALRPDGTSIVTEVDMNGRLLRRLRRDAQGREVIIIDDSAEPRGPGFAGYFVDLPPPAIRIPRELYIRELDHATAEDVYLTLLAPPVDRIERRYGLDEIRYSEPLRLRMPRIDIDTVNFESGSWEITPDQFDRLAFVGQSITRALQRNPGEVFMIEGYTDATGNDVDNLSLSDRRAESVAMVLSSQFKIPPENLTTQGYGKQFLKVPTDGPERANRRVAVQRITPLLMGQN
jgi:outer membrane protein OmpA-like peptidoglycan-associated protein